MALIVTPRDLTRRAQFYEQFAQLTAVGIGIPAALDLLLRNPPAREFREPIRQMIGELAQGSTFSDAIESLGSWVPSFDIALIRAAEKSGRLDAVFRMLAEYYNERALLSRQLLRDLGYPVFVFHFAIFLFPTIAYFTGKLGGIGYFLETFGVLIALYAAVLFGIFASQGKRGLAWRSIFEKFCRPIPILGSARRAWALSRLSAALEALISAGVTIIEAWEMAAAASGSLATLLAVKAWRPELAQGRTPSELVHESPSLFPEVFANLYHSGEVSGQLDETLKRLHKYYAEEAARKFRFLAAWSAKGFYFGVLGFAAFKIVSYYLSYFKTLNDIMK